MSDQVETRTAKHSIPLICALMFTMVLLFLAGLRVHRALGGRRAHFRHHTEVEGRCTINPTSVANSVVAFLLVIGTIAICWQAGLVRNRRMAGVFRDAASARRFAASRPHRTKGNR